MPQYAAPVEQHTADINGHRSFPTIVISKSFLKVHECKYASILKVVKMQEAHDAPECQGASATHIRSFTKAI